MSKLYDLAVIGGGAAGIAAGITASGSGDRVIILESSSTAGRKILASGNGRCNLMNSGTPRYYGSSGFAEKVLSACSFREQIRFWKYIGLFVREENENRIYPCTYQASSVLDALKRGMLILNTEMRLNAAVRKCIRQNDGHFTVHLDDETISARRIVIATGGAASPKLGGSGTGYQFLSEFGHSVEPIKPALVPFTTDLKSISGLSGLRVRCTVSLTNSAGEIIHQEKGEVLFTDYGVSGICVMQCSRFFSNHGEKLELDFTDRLFSTQEQLRRELLKRKSRFHALDPRNLLNGIIPEKLSFAVLKQAGIPLHGEKLQDLRDEIISDVIYALTHYSLILTGTKGMDYAQVTAGGVSCNEFHPESLESRLIPGLHAAGEILNVDGDCGGFNLMFAFASGILAGLNGRKMFFSDSDGKEGENK